MPEKTPIYDNMGKPEPFSHYTPNVVIKNPKAREIARTTLDIVGVALGSIIAFDVASNAVDWLAFTGPAMAVWTYLRLAFGLSVDNTNTPRG